MENALKKFGKNVRFRRSKFNWTQKQLSSFCNLHRTYVAGIESGKRNVSLKNIEKIARALKCKVYELLK